MLESVYSRFPNITIPQGATVTDAYVTYTVDDNYTASSNMTGRIKLQDVDDATAPTTNAGFYAAPRTTATAPWVFQTSWSHDDQVDTSDLTDLVQEVIDRPGWASGNSIGVFIDDPQTGTGTADWAFYAYDQTPAKAPQLHIEYTTSGGLSESASTTYIGGVYERTVTDTDTTETSYYTLTGLVASRTDGVLEWIITDHLGSPNTTVNPSTGATTRRLHDPYGTERHDDGITTDRSFTGQLSDPSSALMFYNARYYDPVTARFISPDTIIPDPSNPQDLNRYTYVRGNPQTLTDPTGHWPWGDCLLPYDDGGNGCIGGGQRIDISNALPSSCGKVTTWDKCIGDTRARSDAAIAPVVDKWDRCRKSSICSSFVSFAGDIVADVPKSVFEAATGLDPVTGEELGLWRWAGLLPLASSFRHADGWAEISGTLRDARRMKGNYGLGTASAADANRMGLAWVGTDHTVHRGGTVLVSADGFRQYRLPSYKDRLGRYQANFEWRTQSSGPWASNGHLDIADMSIDSSP